MRKARDRTIQILLAAALLVFMGTRVRAQDTRDVQSLPGPAAPSLRSIEDLNYVGGDASYPTLSDAIIDPESAFRRSLFRQGMVLHFIAQVQYSQNMLAPPVPAASQVYIGQRPFESGMVQPIFTADLRQLHMRQSQLYMAGTWDWMTWNPAGPKSLQMDGIYIYKALGENRAAIKAGYVYNNLEFVGFFVGGSTASGAQGVYSVLPYEVGMSYFPMATPTFNLQVQGPKNTYFKTGAQRSSDPGGGPTEVARNHTGFRFDPHGDKLLSINEGGFQRTAKPDVHEIYLRAGYLYNFTAYRNAATGRSNSGNECVYALMDYQLTQSNRDHSNQGLYVGGSAEAATQTLNAYARYYEARLYREAPLRSRPDDLASLVASRIGYSKYFTNSLVAEGKTVSRASTTLTGFYSLHASRGNYLVLGLSYDYGPAITPRTGSALKFLTTWTLFF